MTKIQMPEPTAEIRIVGNVTIFDLTPVGKQQGLSVGQKFITTTQAEAYANAMVRVALEEAAQLCYDEAREWDSDGVITEKNYAECCANRIRALIPPTK